MHEHTRLSHHIQMPTPQIFWTMAKVRSPFVCLFPITKTTAIEDKGKLTSNITRPLNTTPMDLAPTTPVACLHNNACHHAPSLTRERIPLEGETQPTATPMLCLTRSTTDSLYPPQKFGTHAFFTGTDKTQLCKQNHTIRIGVQKL